MSLLCRITLYVVVAVKSKHAQRLQKADQQVKKLRLWISTRELYKFWFLRWKINCYIPVKSDISYLYFLSTYLEDLFASSNLCSFVALDDAI